MSSDTAEPVPSDMESNRSRSPSKFAPRDLGMDLELVSSGAGSGRGDAVCKLSVPPLKILGEGVDPGEVGAGEAMRVSRVDSNVTSRSRDASVCSDRSIESCEEGVRERTPSKDGSCASTEESRGNASQNRYVVGLSRPSPCTASSPRGSSPPRTARGNQRWSSQFASWNGAKDFFASVNAHSILSSAVATEHAPTALAAERASSLAKTHADTTQRLDRSTKAH